MTDWQQKYDEMVEKAARALLRETASRQATEADIDQHWKQFKSSWTSDAQAALAAIGITPDRPVWIAPVDAAPKMLKAAEARFGNSWSALEREYTAMRLAAEPHAEKGDG